MYQYIIHDEEGIMKPFIEKYIKCQKYIPNLIQEKCKDLINLEYDYEDVNYDYNLILTLKNHDNIEKSIYKLKRELESSLPITVHLLDEQIEDALLNEAEEEIIIDIYANLKHLGF